MTAQIFTSTNPEIKPYAAVISPTGLPSPVLTDDPNVPRDMLALTAALDQEVVPRFATTAARDAARTAGALFSLCFVGDVVYRWVAGAWVVWSVIDPSLPRGRIAGGPQTGNVDVTVAQVNIMTTPFTLPGPRWIKITCNLQFTQVSANGTAIGATIVVNGASYTRIALGATVSGLNYVFPGTAYVQCPAGANTAYLACTCATGAMRVVIGGQTFMHVEDVGP